MLFSPSGLYSSRKASLGEGSFHYSSSLSSLYLGAKMHCVFSSRVLLSNYDGQPGALAIACVVRGFLVLPDR